MTLKLPAISLQSRIVAASSWVLGGHFTSQALRLISNLIMTRLLVPEMFGVMALANVLIIGVGLFSDVGLKQNIVQSKRGNDPAFLNTAWTIQILRGSIIWLLTLVLAYILRISTTAGWIIPNSVYADPTLHHVTAVLSFAILIGGFQSTKMATANRNLSLGLITGIELISQVAGLVFMISWALIDRSIWAMVGGALIVSSVNVVLTHTILPGEKNILCWDVDAFWDIFHFGKWIFLNSMLFFLASNGDRLLMGGIFDSSTLGLYAIAFLIMNSIELVINKLGRSVAFPAFSEVVRDRPYDLKRTYYKFRLPLDGISLFSVSCLFVTSHLIIDVLYDPRYEDAGHMLQILSITLFMSRYVLANSCFLALGKPKLLIPFMIIQLFSLVVIVPTFNVFWGIDGVLWGIALHRLATLPAYTYLTIKNGIFDFKREFYVLGFIVIGLICGWAINSAGYILLLKDI